MKGKSAEEGFRAFPLAHVLSRESGMADFVDAAEEDVVADEE